MRINARPEKIFPLINDLKAMATWNPFSLRDPTAVFSYTGPASGQGARHSFAGPKSGAGSIEIIDATPTKIDMRLIMTKPVKTDSVVQFALQPVGTATDVTWSITGNQPLLFKTLTMFFNHDKMMGDVFTEGLGNLKRIAE